MGDEMLGHPVQNSGYHWICPHCATDRNNALGDKLLEELVIKFNMLVGRVDVLEHTLEQLNNGDKK